MIAFAVFGETSKRTFSNEPFNIQYSIKYYQNSNVIQLLIETRLKRHSHFRN